MPSPLAAIDGMKGIAALCPSLLPILQQNFLNKLELLFAIHYRRNSILEQRENDLVGGAPGLQHTFMAQYAGSKTRISSSA